MALRICTISISTVWALANPVTADDTASWRRKRDRNCKSSARRPGTLQKEPESSDILTRDLGEKPYWHIERARVKGTRQIPVELIVNGVAVEQRLIEADGHVEDVQFEFTPERSSWIAVRVFPAAHTNPIFVEVDGKPIRASKRERSVVPR